MNAVMSVCVPCGLFHLIPRLPGHPVFECSKTEHWDDPDRGYGLLAAVYNRTTSLRMGLVYYVNLFCSYSIRIQNVQ